MFDLSNKRALVTGALGLLGREHVGALTEGGASIAILDVDEGPASDFAHAIHRRFGVDAVGVGADVTDEKSLKDARARIEARIGPIDVLVNNAALNPKVEGNTNVVGNIRVAGNTDDASATAFERYPIEAWQRALDVNVTGMFLCCRVFGAGMAEKGRGSIINIASTYGMVGPNQSLYRRPDGSQKMFKSPDYPTTKGAVLAFTRYLAAYWGHRGVRVNALSPGGVENGQEDWFVTKYSERTPLSRMAAPSDYRGAVVFLASDEASYMTGANLVVDGGWTAW
ncbi:MAG: SDR family oxidoreductase [Deltaproteobacteria bacterium]|nr:SDR family oxidoreductase [Deltaproteobacteria bacterium]